MSYTRNYCFSNTSLSECNSCSSCRSSCNTGNCNNQRPPCPPTAGGCACIIPPTAAQNGNVLTVVNNQYLPMPLPEAATVNNFEGQMRPSNNGLSMWNYDPMFMEFQVTQSGFIYYSKVFVHEQTTVNSISFALVTDGTLTTGQCYVGIYTETGTLIAQSANQAANWQGAAGFVSTPIPATSLAPGNYFIAFLYNTPDGGVGALARQICSFQGISSGFDVRAFRTAASTYTSLPAQFTLADFDDFTCDYLWTGLA